MPPWEEAWKEYDERGKYDDMRSLAANPNKWVEAAFQAGWEACAQYVKQLVTSKKEE